jgi:UDP-glucose 4-epimerase
MIDTSYLRGRNVAVTGASGFIGVRLCAELKDAGALVTALSRTPTDGPWHSHVSHDFGSGPLAGGALSGIDIVFHLAGYAHALTTPLASDEPYRRINVDGTREVLEASTAAGVRRLVFVSSVKAMGEGGSQQIDENFDATPTSAYGVSKLAAEKLLLAAHRECGLDTRVVRPCLVYGPGQRGNLERLFLLVEKWWFPALMIRTNRRSFVHVDDVVGALLTVSITDGLDGGHYIVCGPQPYSTFDLQDLMLRALGKDSPCWGVPSWALPPLGLLGDFAGAIARRRMPLDTQAVHRLTDSAWYSEARLGTATGYKSTREMEETLRLLAADKSTGHS